MPYVPESNTPDKRYANPSPPNPDPASHHNYCDCKYCVADPKKHPNLHIPLEITE